ncbi:MAG: hypothetical protein E3J29_05815, partial [Dehalococcoidia bacterium]
MPVKTRSRPRTRPVSYRPRRPAARRRLPSRSGLRLPAARGQSLAPWLAFIAVASLAVSMLWLAPLIVDAFEEVLSLFGLGLALIIVALLADARLALKRTLSLDRTLLRIWGGLHLMLLFAFGLLGFVRPEWEVGDVSLAEVSVGGHLGRLLAGSPLGIL